MYLDVCFVTVRLVITSDAVTTGLRYRNVNSDFAFGSHTMMSFSILSLSAMILVKVSIAFLAVSITPTKKNSAIDLQAKTPTRIFSIPFFINYQYRTLHKLWRKDYLSGLFLGLECMSWRLFGDKLRNRPKTCVWK